MMRTVVWWLLLCLSGVALHGQVVLNELKINPLPGRDVNSLFNTCTPGSQVLTGADEWVELFNTDPCDSADIGCYILASNMGSISTLCGGGNPRGWNQGAFVFPPGVKIPPLGFVTVGGASAMFRLNDYEGTRYCGSNRWFLANLGGWMAFCGPDGAVLDAVYWVPVDSSSDVVRTNPSFTSKAEVPCACSGSLNIPSAAELFQQGKIVLGGKFKDVVNATRRAQIYRSPDGGEWQADGPSDSQAGCNAACLPKPDFTRLSPDTARICRGRQVELRALPRLGAWPDGVAFDWRSEPPGVQWSADALKLTPDVSTRIIVRTQSHLCVEFDTVFVEVTKPTSPEFTMPAAVCAGGSTEIKLVETVVGARYHWRFGPQPADTPGPHVRAWPTSGTYEVSVWMELNGCRSDTIRKTLEVRPLPKASFSLSKTTLCNPDTLLVAFTGEAGPDAVFTWSSDGALPPHRYAWSTSGQKRVSLKIEENGCVDSTEAFVTVVAVEAPAFALTDTVLCAGDTVVAVLTGAPAQGARYHWQLGDKSADTPGPHKVTWTAPGVYKISLWMEDGGCRTDTVRATIEVRPQPSATFSMTKTTLCNPDTLLVTFTGEAGPDAVFTWSSDGSLPPHRYAWSTSGQKRVTLKVEENGCVDSVEAFVTVVAAEAPEFSLTASVLCAGDTAVAVLTGAPAQGARYHWQLGDKSADTPGPHKVTWTAPGVYKISLWMKAGGCRTDTVRATIEVRPQPSATFSMSKTTLCNPDTLLVTFTGEAGPDAVFTWSSDGSLPPHRYAWSTSGQKRVTLKVEENGCVDSVVAFVTVVALPAPAFALTDTVLCAGDTVVAVLMGEVLQGVRYIWQLADETTEVHGPHTLAWTKPGVYTVQLWLEQDGCVTDTLRRMVTVLQRPKANFQLNHVTLCYRDTLTAHFIGTAGPDAAYIWSMDGALPPRIPGVRRYHWPTDGRHRIALKVDDQGCVDSVETYVEVVQLEPAFSLEQVGCMSDSVRVSFTGRRRDDQSYHWLVGATAYSSDWDLVLAGVADGVVIRLCVTIPGCSSDTVQQTLRHSAYLKDIRLNISPSTGVAPLDVSAIADGAAHPYLYRWKVAGRSSAQRRRSGRLTEDFLFEAPGLHEIRLEVCDDRGCCRVLVDTVEVGVIDIYVPNAFSPNGDGRNDLFQVFNLEGARRFRLRIFDRWGHEVFTTDQPGQFWDGRHNGADALEGVYIYLLEGEHYDGRPMMQKGTVTLVR